MLLFFEPVKIFDQFTFLMFINHPNVPIWKFSGVVLHGLINLFGLYTVQFGDITVEDDLLVAQGDDSTSSTTEEYACSGA